MHTNILLEIGKKIRKIRLDREMIIQELADKASVSKGLISRIENGRTIPSLPVLLSIIKSLGVELDHFFTGVDQESQNGKIIIRRAHELEPSANDKTDGYDFHQIIRRNFGEMLVEANFLELKPKASRKKVTSDGYQLEYMLEGEVECHIGDEALAITTGDSVYFDSRMPHVASNKSEKSAKMLVLSFSSPNL